MTKVQMEMGSNNPLIIMDGADSDLAVTHAAEFYTSVKTACIFAGDPP